MRESVHIARYSSVCNVLRQWKTSLILTYRVYRLYDTRLSVRNFVYSKDLEGSCGQYSVANCRCDVSAFDLRKSMWQLSKIDLSPFEDRRSMSRCVDLRRSMCRPSKIVVSTFEDRCVDLRRPMC